MLNIIVLATPLVSALLYSAVFDRTVPNSIIIPIAGGGIMNLGFWFFYRESIGPIPELSKSVFGRQHNFLLVSILHFAVIPIPLIFDLGWLVALL